LCQKIKIFNAAFRHPLSSTEQRVLKLSSPYVYHLAGSRKIHTTF
jgi:hypothetical protein